MPSTSIPERLVCPRRGVAKEFADKLGLRRRPPETERCVTAFPGLAVAEGPNSCGYNFNRSVMYHSRGSL